MARGKLTLDFFHDVVCGWCFNISPRLRVLQDEFELDIRHRTFVLQDNPSAMIARFGSMAEAKATILGHWRACRAASDQPNAFNIQGMRNAPFPYPHGLPGALACKAAECLSGQEGHWRMFDGIQDAHIRHARNVADPLVLVDLARMLGWAERTFSNKMSDPKTRRLVEQDRTMARRMQVASIPTIIVRETGARLINSPVDDLRAQIESCARLAA